MTNPNISDRYEMESDDSDELFNKYIEIEYDTSESDGDKENKKCVKASKPNAKKVQLEKLDSFMKEHSKSHMDKDEFNKMWSNLVSELNSVGPPSFSAQEWKIKWSQHKYNRKRKRATTDEMHVGEKISRKDNSNLSNKLDIIIQKEDAILDKLDTTNSLLKEIAQSLRKT